MATEILRPNSDVSIQLSRSSGGSSYALVDDTGSGDGDSTYVYRSVEDGYVRDLYGIPSLSGAVDSINFIEVYARTRRTAGAGGESKRILKTHGVEYLSGIRYDSSSYVLGSREWTTNPYTGSPWTVQEITDLQIGVALRLPTGTGGDVRCTQVYVVVDYVVGISAPTTTAQAASSVQETTARINGQISDDGGEACQYRFRYKKSGGGYSYTAWTGSKTTGQTFYEDISGLDPGSTYYFNAQAKNSAGESAWSNEVTFYTNKVITSSDIGAGADAKSSGNPLATLVKSDTGAGADALVKARAWTAFFELTIATITAYRARFWALKDDDIDEIDLDVYWSGGYNHIYQGSFTGGKWESKTFEQNSVTKARVSFFMKPTHTAKLYDLAFYKVIE